MKWYDDVRIRGRRPKLNKVELGYFDEAYSLSEDDLKSMLQFKKKENTRRRNQEEKETKKKRKPKEEKGFVKSLKDENVTYTVTIKGARGKCTCNIDRNDSSWCKHLYMYQRLKQLLLGEAIEKQMNLFADNSEDYPSE